MPYIDYELQLLLQPFLDELARRRWPNNQVTHSTVAVIVNGGKPEDGLFLVRNGTPVPEAHLTANLIHQHIRDEVDTRETAKRPPLGVAPTPEAYARELQERHEAREG